MTAFMKETQITSSIKIWIRRKKTKASGVVAGSALALVLAGWLSLRFVPLPQALFSPPPAQREFLDRNGLPLRAVRAPGSPFLQPATYSEIPQALVNATLAAEDKRFWRHSGVDWRASMRAAWGLVWHRRIVSGGSTLTQQLIKLAEPRPRTFRTKLIEAAQAARLEQVWDKQRILREYLNRVDYGNLNTGCAAAAEFYFAKPLRDLSAAECALLAGLPQAPTRLNPLRHPERARRRAEWVLQRMRQDGFLTSDELDRAKAEALRMSASRRSFEAPHFVDLLLEQSESGFPERQSAQSRGPDSANRGSPSTPTGIRTTLDLELSRFTEQVVRRQIARLSAQHVGDGAAVIIDNATGGVLALAGSQDYFSPHSGQVNAAWAPRSAGSTFKPFTYLIALERGATPASIVADVPTEFATATGLFAPVNYDHRCHGPMRYRLALANSLNIAAVKVLASIGGPSVLQRRLQECGLTTLTATPEHYGLGLTIGNAEARLLELANAYACLARLGEYRPYALAQEPAAAPRRAFDATDCFLVADILSDNSARALAFGAESNLRFDFPVACKTGTSSDFRDNWAFGYTPEFTVGVWAGNADGSPMQGISGVTGAAPILHELFEHLHRRYGTSWYATPTNLVQLAVHIATGKRLAAPLNSSSADCIVEKFVLGRLPPEATPADYDSQGRIRLGTEYREWLQTSDNWLAGRAVAEDATTALRIVFPLPGTTFYLDPDLPDGGRRIRLRADGSSNATWRSETLRCRTEAGQAVAFLEPGKHRLSVQDPLTGSRCDTWVQVVER